MTGDAVSRAEFSASNSQGVVTRRTWRDTSLPLIGVLALSVAFSTGCGATTTTRTVTVTETVTAESKPEGNASSSPAPRTEAEAESTQYQLGDEFKFARATFTFKKVDVVDHVELDDGGELSADPGEELVIIYGHYVNTTTQPQSFCGSSLGDTVYSYIYDTKGTKLSDVDGKTYHIPGAGSHCGKDLLPGQEDDIVVTGRAVEGSVPAYLELEDRDASDSVVRVSLQ